MMSGPVVCSVALEVQGETTTNIRGKKKTFEKYVLEMNPKKKQQQRQIYEEKKKTPVL